MGLYTVLCLAVFLSCVAFSTYKIYRKIIQKKNGDKAGANDALNFWLVLLSNVTAVLSVYEFVRSFYANIGA